MQNPQTALSDSQPDVTEAVTKSAIPADPHFFQAIVCIEGTYTPQTEDCESGVITTSDGALFKTRLGRKGLQPNLTRRWGKLSPEVPTPSVLWGAYPRLDSKMGERELILSVIDVRSEQYFTIAGAHEGIGSAN